MFDRCWLYGNWGECSSLTLPPPAPLDPNLVAFVRSRGCAHEQAAKNATKVQGPGGPSADVAKEKAVVTSSASEPRREDKLEPEAPGLEEGGCPLVAKSRPGQ